MANGHSVRDYLDANNASVLASATTAITRSFPISSEDSRNCLVQVTFSLIEETNAITIALQDSYDGGTTWANVKSATSIATTKAVQTLTFDTKANTTAGDYVVIEDTSGQAWAVAADVTGSDPEPTGAVWTAIGAAYKTQADISGDTTAANVAATFETAFDGLTGFTAVITSDDTAADGTMTMTQIKGGTVENVVVKDDDDAGAGSITAANTTPGAATLVYEIENNIYDGTDTAMWPLARVVCTTGVGDTATVSNVYISRRY